MPLLSRKVDYALLILSYLHHRPEGGCAREIAARFSLSRAFVANILKLLCHKAVVTSHRGVKGGYLLRRPADQLCLGELMEMLDDPFRLVECNRDGAAEACALTESCPVRNALAEVHQRVLGLLRGVTLADLFRPAPTPSETQFGLEVSVRERVAAVP